MPRLARIVVPDYPHHIVQRGNRKQDVFFAKNDYHKYLELLKYNCDKENVEIWAYCLMTNHVHIVATPGENSNLSKAIGETHKIYTRIINKRQNWTGYLWQGRFSSFPMDETYFLRAVAYVELNPVVAGIVKDPWDYKYSSIHAHLSGTDPLDIIKPEKLLDMVDNWKGYLQQAKADKIEAFQSHARTGRILGNDQFIDKAETLLNRKLRKNKPGPLKR
ncbi:MAG: hypothetical protein Ctma_0664 [Catillopecten margaritatus gill symbiont]|uniref:Transposase IS200-like domain-containing protein n=1 Tax=Catillopecten margaritatus gill symbiont TaxID=3083288 RepID=A0AAU6PG23_9GAMM